jgi:hypothetical protein
MRLKVLCFDHSSGNFCVRNFALTPRKFAAWCSFPRVKNAFVGPQFVNFLCELEKLIGAEFPV